MKYEALARKLRPRLFDEIIGQDHITIPLKNAIISERVHHGYLFTGTRGVGKTTAARIFARAINCKEGTPPDPCNRCQFCREVMDGNSTDVLEMDGASNTGIDDVRRLRENSIYVPARGKYRVNIIDEVHMLSRQAFNGLLKILEEPPPHLIFIFATTEPHRIPETVISRMIRFDFRLVPEAMIRAHLEKICQGEGIEHDGQSLSHISSIAEGSVRDAISVLEQCALMQGGVLTMDNVLSVLGYPGMDSVYRMADSLANERAADSLSLLRGVYGGGVDLKNFYGSILRFFRTVALCKFTGDGEILQGETEQYAAAVEKVSTRLGKEESLFIFDIIVKSEKDILGSEFPLHGFEAMVLRVLSFRNLMNVENLMGREGTPLPEKPKAVVPEDSVRITVTKSSGQEKTTAPSSHGSREEERQSARSDAPSLEGESLWSVFVDRVSMKKKFVLKGLLENMSGGLEGGKFVIRCQFDALLEKLKEEEKWNIIKDVAAELLGKPVEIVLEKENPVKPESRGAVEDRLKLEEKVLGDPVVIELLKEFPGSRISSIRKLDVKPGEGETAGSVETKEKRARNEEHE